jgi:hypothetical protein
LGGTQSWSGRYGEAKILEPYRDLNSGPSVIQSIDSSYTDYATAANVISFFLQREENTLFDPEERVLKSL